MLESERIFVDVELGDRRAAVLDEECVVKLRAGDKPIRRNCDLLPAERGIFMIRRNFSDNQIGARRFFDKRRGVDRIGIVNLGAVHDEISRRRARFGQIDKRTDQDCRYQQIGNRVRNAAVVDRVIQ